MCTLYGSREYGAFTVRIIVDLFAGVRKFHPAASSFEVELEPGAVARELIGKTGIPPDYPVMIVINEKIAAPEDTLQDGDRVGLFSPMGGGIR